MSRDSARLSLNILFLLLFPSNCVYSETPPNQNDCNTNLFITRCCPGGTHIALRKTSKIKSCLSNKNFSEPKTYVFKPDLKTVVDINVLGLPDINLNVSTVTPTGGTPYLLLNGSLYVRTSTNGTLPGYVVLGPNDYCMTHTLLKNKEGGHLVVRYFTLESAITHQPSDNNTEYHKLFAWIISSIFIAVVLVVYGVLKELRNLKGMMLMSSIGSLMIVYLLLFVYALLNYRMINVSLRACALLIYFFIMATFCWINTISIDVWWTFRGFNTVKASRGRSDDWRKYRLYSIYAWGLPLLMTVVLIILDEVTLPQNKLYLKPNLNDGLLTAQIRLYYLDSPLLIILLINGLLFVLTVKNISVIGKNSMKVTRNTKREKTKFWLFCKLSVTMGINWLLEILSAQTALGDYYIADIFNGFIGVIIFIIFVGKKSTWKKLVAMYKRRTTTAGEMSLSPRSSATTQESFSEGSQQTVNSDPRTCALNKLNSIRIIRIRKNLEDKAL